MLRGASAEARAELASKVGSGTLQDTATLGEQLLAVAGVLRSEPALRRVFTDGSVEGEAKAGLAASVFGGKVGDPTLALVEEAVQQRWTSSRDLAGVLEELGIQALVRSAGAQGPRVSDELFAVGQLIDANPDLRDVLSDPARNPDDKVALLSTVLDDKVLPSTQRLVAQAVRSSEPFGRALDTIQRVAADVQDKDLIGGLRVEIGDDVIDGSVASKLDNARRRIAG
jgi:F-type H+-transporting ATPase subunit delta